MALFSKLAVIAVVVTMLSPLAAAAPASQPAPQAGQDDWPKWRGPRGDNRPAISSFPQDLAGGLARRWSVTGLCSGRNASAWSCPAIRGDRLIVTGRDAAKDLVVCLDSRTGRQIWRQEYDAPGKDVQYGNGPRATPLIDGDRVFTFGCMGQVGCWSLADGERVWLKSAAEWGGQRPTWGHASTPLVRGEQLLVMIGGQALVVALDKRTGQKVWASPPGGAGYAALTMVTTGGQERLIAFAADRLVGLAPQTGAGLWEAPWPTAYGMNCTTPLLLDGPNSAASGSAGPPGGGRLLVCSAAKDGKGGVGLLELVDGPAGPKVVWASRQASPMHNDPVVIAGHLYAYSGFSLEDKGFICLDLADGKQKWFTDQLGGPGTVLQVPGPAGPNGAGPPPPGDRLLCLNNRGKLMLVEASPDGFRKLSEFQAITGHPVWTQPVIAQGRLYVRFAGQLICYDLAK